MKKDDVLVSAELAKEKLILEIDRMCHFNNRVFYFELVQAIRNTDLTDCQPQGKWCNYCRKDNHNDSECWSTRPANWKPEGLVNVFGNPIAPAPDQGSVRNATDMRKLLKDAKSLTNLAFNEGRCSEHEPGWKDESGCTMADYARPCNEIELRIDAAIRALPDQKD